MLPCLSLYMLELPCYKHTHVREECSLLTHLELVTATGKSSKQPPGDFFFIIIVV